MNKIERGMDTWNVLTAVRAGGVEDWMKEGLAKKKKTPIQYTDADNSVVIGRGKGGG